jgi:hypothetical protein
MVRDTLRRSGEGEKQKLVVVLVGKGDFKCLQEKCKLLKVYSSR